MYLCVSHVWSLFCSIHFYVDLIFRAFIQAVLLMFVFEQRLSFQMFYFIKKQSRNYFKMQMEVWMCCKLRSWFIAEPWWGFRFWPFYIWKANEQVKIEKTQQAKLFWIQVRHQSLFKCFKIKFHEDWFWKPSYNIEFFVPSIGHQIAWINSWHFLPIFLGSSFYFPFCVFFICYWVFWIQCHHFYNHYLYKRHVFYDFSHFTVCKNKNHIKSWL